MKKLLITIAIVLMTSPCFAWTLSWDAADGADGYQVTYAPSPIGDGDLVNILDVGTSLNTSLEDKGFAIGNRYEMYIQAYKNTDGDGMAFSGHSDHLRWTYPAPPAIIEYQAPPQNPVINP